MCNTFSVNKHSSMNWWYIHYYYYYYYIYSHIKVHMNRQLKQTIMKDNPWMVCNSKIVLLQKIYAPFLQCWSMPNGWNGSQLILRQLRSWLNETRQYGHWRQRFQWDRQMCYKPQKQFKIRVLLLAQCGRHQKQSIPIWWCTIYKSRLKNLFQSIINAQCSNFESVMHCAVETKCKP
jgi:hypothetical protein